jgi:ACS family hexuronate transporter-like MFS transporter
MMFATLLNYMDRQVLPQIATELKDQPYQIDKARYGEVAGNFALAFAAGSIFFGFIADRVGPRLLYPVVLVGWSAAGLATPFMTNPDVTSRFEPSDEPGSGPFYWLLICRTVLGFFEAGHWPCALLTARQILTAKDRPLGNGLLQSGASLGAILVPLYVLVVRKLGGGWEVVFWTIGAIGLLWVPLWLTLVRRGDLDDHQSGSGFGVFFTGLFGLFAALARVVRRLSRRPLADWFLRTTGRSFRSLLTAEFLWAVLQFLRLFGTLFVIILGISVSWQFIREWLPSYLKESQGFSPDEADLVVPLYYISAELGCFAFGLLVRWLVTRGRDVHSARVIGYALFALVTAAAAAAPLVGGWPSVGLIILAGAGILGLHPCYYALTQELPAKHMALLSGFLAAAGWFVVGEVQKAMGRHIEEVSKSGSTGGYDVGFYIAGLAPLAGLIALLVLWKPSRE